jgi:hypothetical protein
MAPVKSAVMTELPSPVKQTERTGEPLAILARCVAAPVVATSNTRTCEKVREMKRGEVVGIAKKSRAKDSAARKEARLGQKEGRKEESALTVPSQEDEAKRVIVGCQTICEMVSVWPTGTGKP